jgi:hypothetical protein
VGNDAESKEDYVKRMREEQSFGSHIELLLLAELLRRNVVVYSTR